jgi:membrane protein implicated in regulation of membrane protease activity
MTPKSQMIIFELLTGQFGFIWIGASVATLVFIGMALFSDWAWLNVLYALLVGALGKWLARGFMDSQRRVEFEQFLIERGGLSKEEAGRKWAERYWKGQL